MSRQDDPFMTLAGMMSSPGQSNDIKFGTVTSGAPLIVNVSGIPLDSDDLLVNTAYTPEKGDEVLVVRINDIDKYVVICKFGGAA